MLTEKELAKRLSEFPGLGVNSLEFIYNCERATGIVSRLLERIAELEKRPTHESVVQRLEAYAAAKDEEARAEICEPNFGLFHEFACQKMGLTFAAKAYRAEFMEPTDG